MTISGESAHKHPHGPRQPDSGQTRPGSVGVRFAARLIDEILAVTIAGIVLYAIGLSDNLVLGGVVAGVLPLVYFVVFEVAWGRSPGKALFGLRVHGPNGAVKPDVRQAVARNLFTVLPIIPYAGAVLGLIAYVVIGVSINRSSTKQGVHDRFAGGTQVVRRS